MNADHIKNLSVAVVVSAQLIVPCLPSLSAAADPWGPWSASSDAPVMVMKADRRSAGSSPADPAVAGVAATPFLWLLSFYQTTIGPVNSGRCPMYPTCSAYSTQAIHKHGPVMGVVMTADRIIHELEEQKYAPLAKVGSRYRYLDPVRDNDFWWHAE
jgi:putative component of membrane protein insertase Oxa1/YidC/SpoIIIJ protein YidD